MSISTKCRKCGRRYNLKDEHAGKKFRCKECEAVVTVPQAEPASFAADDWDDDFGGGTDYEDYGGDEDYGSPPPPPRPRKKKPAAKKKRPTKKKSSRSRSDGGQGAKIGGGVFAALVVLGIVMKVLSAVGLDLGGSWDSYTTPDGNITVLMPGKVKSVPLNQGRQLAPGGQGYGAERRHYACIIVIEPMPAEMLAINRGSNF